MSYSEKYLRETIEITKLVSADKIESIVLEMLSVKRNKGRIFFIGSGGGAGHASHAVNDFRKIANIECYSPSDNVSELTARINDDGWNSSYVNYLKTSSFSSNDAIFIFSVGGGDKERKISENLIACMELALEHDSRIFGVVGRDGGYAASISNNVIIIPNVNDEHITPHTEGWQAIIWHLIVSHPLLLTNEMKWESVNEN